VKESKEHEIVCIPGLRGKDSKEISLTTLAGIIQARMEEIIELVQVEIRNSGVANKIIGGIVITGGGAQLKHLPQLFEFVTGMDARIGYPTEHLANSNRIENIGSPMYATGIGLVLKGFQKLDDQEGYDVVSNTSDIRQHTNPRKRGSFFQEVLSKRLTGIANIFKEDDDE
jgi:cell division protein FtsA